LLDCSEFGNFVITLIYYKRARWRLIQKCGVHTQLFFLFRQRLQEDSCLIY